VAWGAREMKHRKLGHTGLIVSEVALGSMQFGGKMNMGNLGQEGHDPDGEGIPSQAAAASSAARRSDASHEPSWRTPLMKNVGVPLTPLRMPDRMSARIRGT